MLQNETHPEFDAFVATIATLRAPGGCPWDREQTHRSIASNMIEEAYEAVDAIESDDTVHLREELGDVLLQVVLQSQIAADDGEFTIDDVCREVNQKIIRRHPHVFGDAEVQEANEVLEMWDRIKLRERSVPQVETAWEIAMPGGSDESDVLGEAPESSDRDADEQPREDQAKPEGLLDSVPTGFPALIQAQKISRKAVAAGFEWETLDDVWSQVYEEIDELKEAYAAAPKSPHGQVSKEDDAARADVEMECGDVLFALVNVARKMGVNAENCLRAACQKFRHRWSYMESVAADQGHSIEDYSTEQLEALWQQSKEQETL